MNSSLSVAAWEVCSPCASKGAVSRPTRQKHLCHDIAAKPLEGMKAEAKQKRKREIERKIEVRYTDGERGIGRERERQRERE